MDVFAAVVFALCAVVLGAVLKKSNREHAVLLTGGAAILLLGAALRDVIPLLAQLRELSAMEGVSGESFAILLKAVGIGITGQLAASVCKDAGENALAGAVDLTVKAAVLAAALPMLTRLLEYLQEIAAL